MFLRNYVDETYLKLIYDKYDIDFLNSIDSNNFREIYLLFKMYDFNFIEDIILRYLEIFTMPLDYVLVKLEELKDKLGRDYLQRISNDLTYLDYILEENML